jgi:hypothetical protein
MALGMLSVSFLLFVIYYVIGKIRMCRSRCGFERLL